MLLDAATTLLDVLRDSRLLGQAQLDEVSQDLQRRFPDTQELARELIRRGWLTPFQVDELFKGSGRGLVLGPYILLDRLGAGGMGEVYKARHTLMDRVVAVKVIRAERLGSADAVARFRREIQAVARLSHANIIMAHDAAQIGNTQLCAMEYVDGMDLARQLKERGPLPPAQACQLMRQALCGLQHAHERGLVHRDLKPANLLVANDGTLKILDLGLARLHHPDYPTCDLTSAGAVMGTPDYMAPEQALDFHKADIRSDIYSLGCTLYHMLAGRPPFPGGNHIEKILKHRDSDPPPVETLRSGVPRTLAAVIQRMMAKHPDDRYQTAAAALAALEPFAKGRDAVQASGSASADYSAQTPATGRKTLRRQPDFLFVVAGLAAVSLLAAALVVYPRNAAQDRRDNDAHNPAGDKNRPVLPAVGIGPARRVPHAPVDVSWEVELFKPGQGIDVHPWGRIDAVGAPLPNKNDRLSIKAGFNQPVFTYVLAVNPDGSCQLVHPESAADSRPVKELRVPAGLHFLTLDDDGFQALILAAAGQPLPPFDDWKPVINTVAWKKVRTNSVWNFDGERLLPVHGERLGKAAQGPPPLAELCSALQKRPEIAAVRALAFPVRLPP